MSLSDDYKAGRVDLPLKMDRTIPFVKCVFEVMDGSTSISDAVALLRQAEIANDIQVVKPVVPDLPWLPDEQYEAVMQGNFYDFMSQTHIIFEPWVYDEVSLLLPHGYTWVATWRAWSATLAEWANQVNYGGYSDWNYVDIYSGLGNKLDEYDEWSKIVLRIIESKIKST